MKAYFLMSTKQILTDAN